MEVTFGIADAPLDVDIEELAGLEAPVRFDDREVLFGLHHRVHADRARSNGRFEPVIRPTELVTLEPHVLPPAIEPIVLDVVTTCAAMGEEREVRQVVEGGIGRASW